jgi:transposase, IS5 family
MPIQNIEDSQRQGRLFYDKLSKELSPKHKLYKLKELISWSDLEEQVIKLVNVEQLGRERKSIRVMLGLSMLQAMYNFSDCLSSETFEENVYWQYFCGYEYIDTKISISESAIRRFRQELGEEGYNLILRELTKVGLRVGAYKKKDLDSVIIDTTVQIKNIKHPHDAYLLGKAREELVGLAHKLNIPLNETYEKKYKKGLIQLWKYKDASKSKKRIKTMKHLKVLVGRLIRAVERRLLKSAIELKDQEWILFDRIKQVHAQSFLSKDAKEKYKKAGNNVIYSFHAKEVECIGKGKLNKPYEFGNKVAIAVSGRGNFILGVKSFHGNPYDGHTLAQTVTQIEKITDHEPNKIFVDLGYRGSNYSKKGKIYTPYTKKEITPEIKAMQSRRSAIEPVIGHLKQYGRMGRNYLKGAIGDIVNPLISAIGFNLRGIANKVILGT